MYFIHTSLSETSELNINFRTDFISFPFGQNWRRRARDERPRGSCEPELELAHPRCVIVVIDQNRPETKRQFERLDRAATEVVLGLREVVLPAALRRTTSLSGLRPASEVVSLLQAFLRIPARGRYRDYRYRYQDRLLPPQPTEDAVDTTQRRRSGRRHVTEGQGHLRRRQVPGKNQSTVVMFVSIRYILKITTKE